MMGMHRAVNVLVALAGVSFFLGGAAYAGVFLAADLMPEGEVVVWLVVGWVAIVIAASLTGAACWINGRVP